MAQIARESGAKVIVITNYAHSKSVESRHSSGMKLFQLSDIFLDTFGEIGDAAINLDGLHTNVGATSTVVGAALINAVMVQAAAIVLENDLVPEVFNSSNSNAGESHNNVLISKYKKDIHFL